MPRRPPKGDDERPGGASRRVKVKAPSEKLEADLKAIVGSSRHSCIRFLEYGAQRGSQSRNPRCTSASVESENIEAKKRLNGVLRVPTSHLSCSRLQPRHSNKGISDAYHCSQRQQNLHCASSPLRAGRNQNQKQFGFLHFFIGEPRPGSRSRLRENLDPDLDPD